MYAKFYKDHKAIATLSIGQIINNKCQVVKMCYVLHFLLAFRFVNNNGTQ